MNEETIKNTKILPFLEKLGLDRENDIEYEKTLDDGSRLDILLKHNNQNICVLECKKSNINISQEKIIRQVYNYATNFEINSRFFALSNGNEFHLYEIINRKFLIYQNELENINDNEIEKIKDILFNGKIPKELKKEDDKWYLEKKLPKVIVKPRKRATRRHFGVHVYFTKQSWDVVGQCINNFSQPGDTILDPFGGTGVTFIESLINGRNAIHIDLNPLSIFWMEVFISDCDLFQLREEADKIGEKFKKLITKTELKDIISFLPKDEPLLSKGADVKFLHEVFSKEQLTKLGLLKKLILEVKSKTIKKHLLLAFSSTVEKNNLTYHNNKNAKKNIDEGGGSGIQRYYRYRIAPNPVILDPLYVFSKNKINNLIKAKKELQIIPDVVRKNAKVYKGDATDLEIRINGNIKTQGIENESIDYIYTDPPYGKKIEYLDLSVIWNAWLDLKVTDEDYQREAIEGGHLNKSRETYGKMIIQSLKEMFRVLKWNRWMSFVFQHQDPYYWYLIVENAEKIGFEYKGVVRQNNGQTSFKKRQNPFSVLSGQLIIHFIKKKDPQSIMKSDLGQDVTALILNNVESVIAEKDGATINEINDFLVIHALELGFLDKLSEYGDLTTYLRNNFAYDQESEKYHLREETSFKSHIPIEKRVKYFLLSYLRRENRQNNYPDFSDIVYGIMPLLKNGKTPEEQTIKKVLNDIAIHDEKDGYLLKENDKNQDQLTLI